MADMSEAEKVQLRYNFVMEKTSIAVGQFKREHDNASTQLESFKELMKEIGTTFGETIIPVSYTHLDVYKRQCLNLVLTGLLNM